MPLLPDGVFFYITKNTCSFVKLLGFATFIFEETDKKFQAVVHSDN